MTFCELLGDYVVIAIMIATTPIGHMPKGGIMKMVVSQSDDNLDSHFVTSPIDTVYIRRITST